MVLTLRPFQLPTAETGGHVCPNSAVQPVQRVVTPGAREGLVMLLLQKQQTTAACWNMEECEFIF